ncbi:MAG: flagellin [Phycisphaerales bacterium]|jgi:flagellin
MTRINTNVPSMIARSNLSRTNRELDTRLERLSTGLRINRGADDPAGLIISERLRSNIRGAEQGIKNSERASAVIATTEGSLTEVNDLLNSIKALVVEAANTGAFSDEEIAANQAQIDSAIDSITRIADTARFGDLRLLDGSLGYQTSGIATSAVAKTDVRAASFSQGDSLDVNIEILNSAQQGGLYVRGDLPTPGAPGNGTILSTVVLEVRGPDGVVSLEFTSGQSFTEVASAINRLTPSTGVTAELINGDAASGLVFFSEGYGTRSFVSVERLQDPGPDGAWQTYKFADELSIGDNDPFPWTSVGTDLLTAVRDQGRDVQAIINGALATGDGLSVKTASTQLSLDLILTEDFATRAGETSSFDITGGGSLFQLGSEVVAQQQVNFGINSVAASRLGGTVVDGSLEFLESLKSGRENSLASSKDRGNFTAASRITDTAIDEITIVRGRLGSFERNTLQTNIRSLALSVENLTASESLIRDADFAKETSLLTRAQILASSGTTILGLANQQAQSVLQLLG